MRIKQILNIDITILTEKNEIKKIPLTESNNFTNVSLTWEDGVLISFVASKD